MQDSFARARTRPNAAARPSARATIGYLVYKHRVNNGPNLILEFCPACRTAQKGQRKFFASKFMQENG